MYSVTIVISVPWDTERVSQLFHHFWEDPEKFGIHRSFGSAGCGRRQEGRVNYRARQLLCVRSCQWHALIDQLFVTSPWEEENGRAQGVESLSEKKAIRERREVRLMFTQWEQLDQTSTASALNFPRQETHLLWPSSACRASGISGGEVWGSYGVKAAHIARWLHPFRGASSP